MCGTVSQVIKNINIIFQNAPCIVTIAQKNGINVSTQPGSSPKTAINNGLSFESLTNIAEKTSSIAQNVQPEVFNQCSNEIYQAKPEVIGNPIEYYKLALVLPKLVQQLPQPKVLQIGGNEEKQLPGVLDGVIMIDN